MNKLLVKYKVQIPSSLSVKGAMTEKGMFITKMAPKCHFV